MPSGKHGFDSTWLKSLELKQKQRERDGARTPAVVERDNRDESVGPAPIQKADDERVIVRVYSVRKRLLDEDNLCEKFLVDALRYLGFIADDRASTTKIEVSQRKCRPDGETEHVRIEIL